MSDGRVSAQEASPLLAGASLWIFSVCLGDLETLLTELQATFVYPHQTEATESAG